MSSVAHRLHTVEEYYFSRKLKEVRALLSEGKPIINLGIGSPDLPPPPQVVEALNTSLSDVSAHKYQSYQGLPELRMAISDFYKKNYGVELNSESEILPLMGSKEGIMHISMAYLNEGDAVLIPNPGYPTYSSVTKLLGATPIFYDLKYESQWQPNLDELSKMDLSKVKLMWVNYPHMPTGTNASKSHLSALIQFAKAHNILLINDNPYSFILNDEYLSLLKVKGYKDFALELNSLSKSFNMSGWRVGMLVGSSDNITKVLKVKSNMDSGMFYGIQKGAIAPLNLDKSWFEDLNKVYLKRRKLIWNIADKLNCSYDKNSKGLFVWAKLPNHIKSSEQYIDTLLKEKKIFIAPGTIFGSNGEGYIRFSLCIEEVKINEALKRIEL